MPNVVYSINDDLNVLNSMAPQSNTNQQGVGAKLKTWFNKRFGEPATSGSNTHEQRQPQAHIASRQPVDAPSGQGQRSSQVNQAYPQQPQHPAQQSQQQASAVGGREAAPAGANAQGAQAPGNAAPSGNKMVQDLQSFFADLQNGEASRYTLREVLQAPAARPVCLPLFGGSILAATAVARFL